MSYRVVTRAVNRPTSLANLARRRRLDYNRPVRTVASSRALPGVALLLLIAPLLGAGSCTKSEAPKDEATPTELPPLPDEPAGEKKPVEGAKLDGMKDDDKARFEALVDKLPSPCGKGHSLRTSRNTDATCVRARFAVDYVTELLKDGASDDELKELYVARYPKDRTVRPLKVGADVPHLGPDDARVVFVEFFDYGCPACGQFAPVLKEVQAAYPRDVAIYYKMFPLAAHADSPGAAQAAVAAGKQGKFHEMHELLFADQYAHKKENLDAYAQKLGLDKAKFEADYAAATAAVEADKAEGNASGVQGTPTIFLNGVLWEGPGAAKYMKMWVEEELALNR
jgi:protein-disulfide isomerase